MVRITNIKVTGRGPVVNFDEKIYPLTLIYSKNEEGKTSIVEGIIQSLFKKANVGEIRIEDDYPLGTVRVAVEGLEDKGKIFTPSSKKKLDDYFIRDDFALPPKLVKLLYVRAAEVGFVKESKGVDWEILKNVLSSENIIDSIMERLPSEVDKNYAELIGDKLTGQKRGVVKKLNEELYPAIKCIAGFYKDIDSISYGEVVNIEKKIVATRKEQEQLEKVKKYFAFKLSKDFKIKNSELSSPSMKSKLLNCIRENMWKYDQLREDIEELKEKRAKINLALNDHLWLETAKDRCNRLRKSKKGVIGRIVAGIGFAGILTGLLLDKTLISLISLVVVLIGWLLPPVSDKGSILKELKDEYKEKFKEPFTLNSLDTHLKSMENKKEKLVDYEAELSDKVVKLKNLDNDLNRLFAEAGMDNVKESERDNILHKLDKRKDTLKEEVVEIKVQLDGLNIAEDEYITDGAGIELDFTPLKEKELADKLNSLKEEKGRLDSGMHEIRGSLGKFLGVSENISGMPWEEIVNGLQEKQNSVIEEISDITSSFIAGKVVKEVLDEMRCKEKENIVKKLNNENVRKYLKKFTSRYTALDIEGKAITVSDDSGIPYYLRNLSTGVTEQVLLAIRCGVSLELSRGMPLFFILDDAFQYSDWERRESLVAGMEDLVKNGWQVIYFTMDENIRELFNSAGKRLGSDKYKEIVL